MPISRSIREIIELLEEKEEPPEEKLKREGDTIHLSELGEFKRKQGLEQGKRIVGGKSTVKMGGKKASYSYVKVSNMATSHELNPSSNTSSIAKSLLSNLTSSDTIEMTDPNLASLIANEDIDEKSLQILINALKRGK